MVTDIFQKMYLNHTTIVTFLFKKIPIMSKKDQKSHENRRKYTSKKSWFCFFFKITIVWWSFYKKKIHVSIGDSTKNMYNENPYLKKTL